MTVYEAIRKAHYEKIIRFIKEQPEDYLLRMCMRYPIPLLDAKFIEYMKKENPEIHLFWVEDKQKQMRGVFYIRFRKIEKPLPDQPDTFATLAFVCTLKEDFDNDNPTYFNELMNFLIHNYSGITKPSVTGEYIPFGEFRALPRVYEWSKRLFGEALTDIEARDNPIFGLVTRFKVDFKKYLGV